jgi:hypothetical protein
MVTFHHGGGKMNENNNSTFLSSIVFVLLSILTALTVGFMAGIVGTFVYPIIIFPILVGILGGRMITDNVKLTKMRNLSLIKLDLIAGMNPGWKDLYEEYFGK